ncbi:hypothetical protein BGZ65_001010 [Modicella reniformis]|uniref:ubiquitinyl hydrolase 1 n=1 Tax=Modicella reniformis TaxID=1440133 RepID=A0A9P6MA50_9FUNG|nr:hypothetical protein BGZ65_001010 [Modicella reniformis]
MDADFSSAFSTREMQEILPSKSWVLAKSSNDTNQQLYTTRECRPESEAILLGDQMPLSAFKFNNKNLIKCMGWDEPPPLNKVLARFLKMIDRLATEAVSDKDAFAFYEIYCHLLESTGDPSDLATVQKALAGKPWILINGTLHTVDRVALKLTCDLAPHFVQITSSDSRLSKLFLVMGVRETVGQADLQGLISAVAARYGEGEKISQADSDFVVKILQAMTDKAVNFQWTADLLIPATDNILCKITEVVYDDAGAQAKTSSAWTAASVNGNAPSYKFTSSKISKSMAEKLQISMLSTRCWDDQKESWSQEEKILGRIVNILNDYDPSSIFTEFLQNAADAGATKCCFMLDLTSYPRSKVLSREMATWQGPALVIYNDAEFTESDFIALSRLGVGSKHTDSSKIGRHGLGFNSVYHFTDVPSVVSGQYIGFFDPRHLYLPKNRTTQVLVAQGGQRCNFVKLNREALSDQLVPYKGIFGCDMESHFKGTIFRIPLRTLDTKQPKTNEKKFQHQWTLMEIQSMLRSWIEDAKVGMLFLKDMKTIEIREGVRERDSIDFKWTATKTVGTGNPLLDKILAEQPHDPSSLTHIVEIRETTSASLNLDVSKWLVYTEKGFLRGTESDVKTLAKKNRWSPERGVAIPLSFNNNRPGQIRGRLFAHLPTPIHTNLQFHIHGVFALTSNRKGLAGGSDVVDPKCKWNCFVMETCLPQTAANAFEKLVKWMFREGNQGGPRATDIEFTTSQYFRFWPTTDTDDGSGRYGIDVFIKRFIRTSYARSIFPCKIARKSPPVVGCKGQEVVFAGPSLKNAPSDLIRAIREQLQTMGINVCDCPETVQSRIENDWKSSPGYAALSFRQINPDLVRQLIRKNPTFIPKLVKSDEGVRWILGYTLRVLLDPKALAAVTEPLSGLALIPLTNGEWKELQIEGPSTPVYYTAKNEMQALIKESNVLVNEAIFKTPNQNLERIFGRLVRDTPYCIKEMPPEKFAQVICELNPDGVSVDLRNKLWRLLETSNTDLKTFSEVSILKTLDGHIRPLKYAFQGLEISMIQDVNLKQRMRALGLLLTDIGIVVFDAVQNSKHPLLKQGPKADNLTVLRAIAQSCGGSWPEGRVITKEEAAILRDMINSSGDEIKPLALNLGHLCIWQSWAPNPPAGRDRPLICARGSFFPEGNRTFEWISSGSNSDVIRNTDSKHLSAMGAKPLSIVHAVETKLLPQLQDGTLRCIGAVKTEYIEVFKEIIHSAAQSGRKSNPAAQELIQNKGFILARDGSFRSSNTLFVPDDPLCNTIFADMPSKFPDHSVWAQIGARKYLFSFRDSKNSDVVRECAMHVLDLIQGRKRLSPDAVRSRAIALIEFIYKDEEGLTNWLEPQWKIVPAEVTTRSPHSTRVPDVPAYQSFGELMESQWHDVVWTQCAFFPETLKPSLQFKKRYPSVGKPHLGLVVDHLKVLVTDLAPIWTPMDQQLALKTALIGVYKLLEGVASHGSKAITRLLQEQLHVPYILSGLNADSSDSNSWVWPRQLTFGIENNMDHLLAVPRILQPYRQFLLAAGAQEMQAVEGSIRVSEGRKVGDIEARLRNCFEAQDQHSGFMDVRFKFANGRQILAHKFVLVHENDYFNRRFTGVWAEHTTREPLNPGVAVIDLSNQEKYEIFYGLLHYFYTNYLIITNGPLDLPFKDANKGSGATGVNNSDELQDRVQYLVDLLHLSNQYESTRLKELIAFEIVKKLTYGNVFSVREHAELSECKELPERCDEYMRKNATGVRAYLNKQLESHRKSLHNLMGDGDGIQRAELKEDIEELENNQKALEKLIQDTTKASKMQQQQQPTAPTPGGVAPQRDEVQLTDEQILTQMQAIQDEQANAHPLVDNSEDLTELEKEYENGSAVFKNKILNLADTHDRMRRLRGDGNCFYRAFAFAWFERVMLANTKPELLANAILAIKESKDLLTAAQFEPLAFEDFYHTTLDVLENLSNTQPEGLLNVFRTDEISNSIVMHFRLMASAYLKTHQDQYAPFLEFGQTMDEYCSMHVEAMGRESEEMMLIALTKATHVSVEVAYLSGDEGSDEVNFLPFLPDTIPYMPPLVLLYRPGHYDILYRKSHCLAGVI